MKAFDKASLALVPDGIKDGKLYSIKPTDGSGDFTFSRGSNLAATRVDENGLIEKGRENLLEYSEEFDNPYYLKLLGTLTTNQTTAPDGSLTADLFTKTSGVDTVSELRANGVYSSTGIFTFSIYVKQNVGDGVLLRLDAAGNTANASFQFSTKSISTQGYLVIDATATELANGWFRLSLTGNVTNTSWGLSIANLFSNPTNDSIFVWGAQLEQGLVATDYIETGASTAQAGVLEDLPRIDYTGGTPSLLLERSRTNLAFNSETFGGSGVGSVYMNSKIDVTYTPNYGISPEGVKNSTRVQFNDSTAFSYRSVSLSEDNTGSLYVKGTAGEDIRFGFGINVATDGTIHTFDGTWQRVTHTSSTGTQFYLSNYTGTGNQASDFEIYGLQHEIGSYATSYIPTYGTAATRGSEAIPQKTINPTSNNTFTVFFELNLDNMFLVSNEQFLLLRDFASRTYQSFRMFTKNGEHVIVPYFNEDSAYVFDTNVDANRSDTGKVVFRANGDGSYDMFIRYNGTTNKRSGSGLTAYNLAKTSFSGDASINLKSFLVFDDPLSDAECIRLTTENLTLTKPAFVGGAGLNNFVVAVSGDIAGGSGTIETNWQWQISNDGNTWADVNGATNDYYTIPNNTNLLGKYIRVEQSINDEYGTLTVVASDGQQILQLAGLFDSVPGTAGYSLNRLRSQTPSASAARVTRDGTHFTTIGFTSDDLFDSAAAMAYATQTGNIARYIFNEEFDVNTFGVYYGGIDVLLTPFRGEENVLVYEVANDGVDNQRFFAKSILDPTLGHTIRFQAKVFIPSNQKIDKVRFWTGYGADGFIDVTTTDTWVDVDQTLLITTGVQARVQAYYDTNLSFEAPGDKFYIKDLTITDTTPNLHVQTLYDQSGNNKHAVQNALQSMPMIIENGVLVEENGKPALKFDGVDDDLNSVGADLVIGNSSYAAFTIAKSETTLLSNYYFGINATANGSGTGRVSALTPEIAVRVSGANCIFSDSASGSQELLSLLYDGTTIQNHSLHINGTSSAISSSSNGTSPMNIASGDFRIGGWGVSAGYLNGTIQELIIFDSDQSKIREGVERVMANRYNIDLS